MSQLFWMQSRVSNAVSGSWRGPNVSHVKSASASSVQRLLVTTSKYITKINHNRAFADYHFNLSVRGDCRAGHCYPVGSQVLCQI